MRDFISREELAAIASKGFGDLAKAVVDVEQEIMAVGCELHVDAEVALFEECGAKREHTWGINIYPKKSGEEMIEFDSMVNIKPAHGNRSRWVEDAHVREKIRRIVQKLTAKLSS